MKTTRWSETGNGYIQRYAWILMADNAYVSTSGGKTNNYLEVLVFVDRAEAEGWAWLHRSAFNTIPMAHYGTLMIKPSEIRKMIKKIA